MVKDYSFLTTFYRKDLMAVKALTRRLRDQDLELAENYIGCCERGAKGNDVVLEFDDNRLPFVAVNKSEDLVVTDGLNQCVDIIRGASSARWNSIHYTTNTASAAAVGDHALSSSPSLAVFMSIAQNGGWTLQIGMKMFFGVVGGEGFAVEQGIKEMGVFNSASPIPIMLNRNLFVNNPLAITSGHSVFILSSVVELCPTA